MRKLYTLGLIAILPALLTAQITLQTSISSIHCFGGNNGSVLVNATGGASPYTYSWNNGETGTQLSNLSAGVYTVTVTDQNGVTATKSVDLMQPPLLGVTLNGQPQICPEAPDGFTYAIATGGTPPFSYSWSNGTKTQLNNHLTANQYQVTVTDTKGCVSTGSYTVGYLGIGLYLFESTEPAVCPEADNGSAKISVASGNAPYEYQWSTDATSTQIQDLKPGIYTVTVTDVNGCQAVKEVAVEREDADPSLIEVLLPQCTKRTYDFESTEDYRIFNWTLNDPRDSIISGAGTNRVQVKWGAPGAKELTVSMSDSTTLCNTGSVYKVNVYECAVETVEAGIEALTINPNPFDNQLIIKNGQVASTQRVYARLCDAQGRNLLQTAIENDETVLSTEGYPSGLYLLHITDGIHNRTVKLVK